MTHTLKFSALLLGAPLLLSGCLSDYPPFQEIDQSQLCIATSDEQAMQCPEGELFMARLTQPNRDIRAFNTLNTAALYCDTNHPIFENDAGIMCVMTHQRIDTLTGEGGSAPGMESQQQSQQQSQQPDQQETPHNDQASDTASQ